MSSVGPGRTLLYGPNKHFFTRPAEQLISAVTVRLNSRSLDHVATQLNAQSELGELLRGFLASATGDSDNSIDWCALEVVSLCHEVHTGLVCVTCGRDKNPTEVCKAVCCDR